MKEKINPKLEELLKRQKEIAADNRALMAKLGINTNDANEETATGAATSSSPVAEETPAIAGKIDLKEEPGKREFKNVKIPPASSIPASAFDAKNLPEIDLQIKKRDWKSAQIPKASGIPPSSALEEYSKNKKKDKPAQKDKNKPEQVVASTPKPITAKPDVAIENEEQTEAPETPEYLKNPPIFEGPDPNDEDAVREKAIQEGEADGDLIRSDFENARREEEGAEQKAKEIVRRIQEEIGNLQKANEELKKQITEALKAANNKDGNKDNNEAEKLRQALSEQTATVQKLQEELSRAQEEAEDAAERERNFINTLDERIDELLQANEKLMGEVAGEPGRQGEAVSKAKEEERQKLLQLKGEMEQAREQAQNAAVEHERIAKELEEQNKLLQKANEELNAKLAEAQDQKQATGTESIEYRGKLQELAQQAGAFQLAVQGLQEINVRLEVEINNAAKAMREMKLKIKTLKSLRTRDQEIIDTLLVRERLESIKRYAEWMNAERAKKKKQEEEMTQASLVLQQANSKEEQLAAIEKMSQIIFALTSFINKNLVGENGDDGNSIGAIPPGIKMIEAGEPVEKRMIEAGISVEKRMLGDGKREIIKPTPQEEIPGTPIDINMVEVKRIRELGPGETLPADDEKAKKPEDKKPEEAEAFRLRMEIYILLEQIKKRQNVEGSITMLIAVIIDARSKGWKGFSEGETKQCTTLLHLLEAVKTGGGDVLMDNLFFMFLGTINININNGTININNPPATPTTAEPIITPPPKEPGIRRRPEDGPEESLEDLRDLYLKAKRLRGNVFRGKFGRLFGRTLEFRGNKIDFGGDTGWEDLNTIKKEYEKKLSYYREEKIHNLQDKIRDGITNETMTAVEGTEAMKGRIIQLLSEEQENIDQRVENGVEKNRLEKMKTWFRQIKWWKRGGVGLMLAGGAMLTAGTAVGAGLVATRAVVGGYGMYVGVEGMLEGTRILGHKGFLNEVIEEAKGKVKVNKETKSYDRISLHEYISKLDPDNIKREAARLRMLQLEKGLSIDKMDVQGIAAEIIRRDNVLLAEEVFKRRKEGQPANEAFADELMKNLLSQESARNFDIQEDTDTERSKKASRKIIAGLAGGTVGWLIGGKLFAQAEDAPVASETAIPPDGSDVVPPETLSPDVEGVKILRGDGISQAVKRFLDSNEGIAEQVGYDETMKNADTQTQAVFFRGLMKKIGAIGPDGQEHGLTEGAIGKELGVKIVDGQPVIEIIDPDTDAVLGTHDEPSDFNHEKNRLEYDRGERHYDAQGNEITETSAETPVAETSTGEPIKADIKGVQLPKLNPYDYAYKPNMPPIEEKPLVDDLTQGQEAANAMNPVEELLQRKITWVENGNATNLENMARNSSFLDDYRKYLRMDAFRFMDPKEVSDKVFYDSPKVLQKLHDHMGNLQKITGEIPRGETPFAEAESVSDYIHRATRKAMEMGEKYVKKIKLFK